MNLLIVAPNAPPKNTAQSIQFGKFLLELKGRFKITLVTTDGDGRPVENSDVLNGIKVITLKSGYSRVRARAQESKLLRPYILPDKDIWLASRADEIIGLLAGEIDLIYSRSFPFSSAVLSLELKKRLGKPWIMHLSDLWADSPYRSVSPLLQRKDLEIERKCFFSADIISTTTNNAVMFYKEKYPEIREKFYVQHHIANEHNLKPFDKKDDKFYLIYAGALYGLRRLTVLLDVLDTVREESPELLGFLEFKIFGSIDKKVLSEISSYGFEQVQVMGKINYDDVQKETAKADMILSVEPDDGNLLLKCFLPSKIVDAVASMKPLLCITPEGSEAWKLCNEGYGYGYTPESKGAIKNFLVECLTLCSEGRPQPKIDFELPQRFTAAYSMKIFQEYSYMLTNDISSGESQ